jgi:hypothetical protein
MPTFEELTTLMGDPPAGWNNSAMRWIVIGVHLLIALFVLILIIVYMGRLHNTLVTPTPPKGWSDHDYDADRINRLSLQQYIAANNIPDTTPMVSFAVATANFGGVFTEDVNPWLGSVSTEAARLQVDAGARAIIFDIWPDPADPTSPIVASMLDTSEWSTIAWWRDHGLGTGVGKYSNWQKLTRNSAPLGDVLTAATTAAFQAPAGTQNADPFFLILNLHGAMTPAYLTRLAMIVSGAVGQNNMGADWVRAKGQRNLCSEPYTTFINKAFVIVCPDIDAGYNSLPNVNNWNDFAIQFLASDMGEVTNALELGPNTIHFRPSGISALTTANQANCRLSGPSITLPAAGFCVVQPSIGAQTTENDTLFKDNNYTACLATGAQFVAVNLFSPTGADDTLLTFFDSTHFGKYSFKKGV